jgi:hypothetical protein
MVLYKIGGRIWLNPPYSKPLIWQFVEKLAEHGNGIALLFNRYDVFEESNKILPSRWNTWGQPGCGSVLIAFGRENAEILRNCSLQGKYVELNNDK